MPACGGRGVRRSYLTTARERRHPGPNREEETADPPREEEEEVPVAPPVHNDAGRGPGGGGGAEMTQHDVCLLQARARQRNHSHVTQTRSSAPRGQFFIWTVPMDFY